MRYNTDEHASSCKAMLLTITSIGICKNVTEVIFLNIVILFLELPQFIFSAHFENQHINWNTAFEQSNITGNHYA